MLSFQSVEDRAMKVFMRSGLVSLAVTFLLLIPTSSDAVKPIYYDSYTAPALTVEFDRDRPGGDYHNFVMHRGSELQCQDACVKDRRCRAWTYVKPGFQGRKGRCWLKSVQPRAVRSNCCISGTK